MSNENEPDISISASLKALMSSENGHDISLSMRINLMVMSMLVSVVYLLSNQQPVLLPCYLNVSMHDGTLENMATYWLY